MEAAVDQPVVPVVVHRVREVDDRVQGRHGRLGERQVQQEIVGDGPHALVRHDDPDDDEVAHHGHHDDAAVGQTPEDDPPHRLDELVPVRRAVGVRGVGPVPVQQRGVRGVVEGVHGWRAGGLVIVIRRV